MKSLYRLAFLLSISIHSFGQIPAISDFSPTSGPIGTSVTITGSNFSSISSDNIVYFGAVKANVTNALLNELTVSVPPGATYQPISVSVSGLTAYSTKIFITTFPEGGFIDQTSFGSPVSFTTADFAQKVTIGDLDGDGKSDIALVVIDNQTNQTLSVFRNVSTGSLISFAPGVDFPLGRNGADIAIGDLDGDGKLDIAVTSEPMHNVSVLRNISTPGSITTGSFEPKVTFPTAQFPFDVSIADLDLDGKPELVVATEFSKISVLKNTTTTGTMTMASFAAAVDLTVGTESLCVSTGDLDGDGKPEVIATSTDGNTISILRNTTSPGSITAGSFAPKVDFATGLYPFGIAIADLDGDDKSDIAVINNTSSSVSVFRNISALGSITTSSFSAKVDFPLGYAPTFIAAADIDGDGKPELCINGQSTLSIFRNISAQGILSIGSFEPKVDVSIEASQYYRPVAAGDLNNDGKPDLTYSGVNEINILPNTTFVIKQNQSISFNAVANTKTLGDPPFSLDATASSGLPVQFSTSSDKISLAGNQVTLLMPGSVTITANQSGNDTFMGASPVSQTFCINPMKPRITIENESNGLPILVSSSSSGNQWYHNGFAVDGETSSSLNVTESGFYNVKVTIDNCVSQISDDTNLTVTGIENAHRGTALVYPIPAQQRISLELSGFDNGRPIEILIYNTLSQLIDRATANSNQHKLDLDISKLPKGIYILHAGQEKITRQIKFVKED